MAEIDKPTIPKPFNWEVAMIEPPAPVEPTPVQPTPPPPPQAKPVQKVVEPRPVEKPVVPVQQQTVAPTPVETVQPIEQMTQDVVMPVETVTERVPQQVTETRQESRPLVAQTVTPTQETPIIEQTSPAPTVSEFVERSQPTTVESTPHAKRPEVVEHNAPPVMDAPAVVEKSAPAIEHRSVEHRQVHVRQTQTDYGWLSSLLYGRIEQLKRYPSIARSNHWEGKVVVQATIREDGTVLGVQIAESSGRPVLDQEALSVMQKLSPLRLPHPLGVKQKTILVPISYRLDG